MTDSAIYNAPPVALLSGGKASAAEFTARRISMAMVRDIELSVSHVVEALMQFEGLCTQFARLSSFSFSSSALVGRGGVSVDADRREDVRGMFPSRPRFVRWFIYYSFLLNSYSILFLIVFLQFDFFPSLHNVFLHLFDCLFVLIYSTCTHITTLQECKHISLPNCIHQTHHGDSIDCLPLR